VAGETRDQHTVSRALLRRFASGTPRELSVLDLSTGKTRRRGARGVFYERDFARHHVSQLELLWKSVEDPLGGVLDKLVSEQDLAPEDHDVLKRCLALHWARSGGIAEAHARVYNEVLEDHIRTWAMRPDVLDRIFLEKTGLVPAGLQARLLALELLAEGAPEINDGRYFAARLPQIFQAGLGKISPHHIQIVTASPGTEFCIGDTPVVTSRQDRAGWGPHQRIALGDAQMISMPLTPRFAVALHSQPNMHLDADAELVDNFNRCQCAAARRYVAFRPGSSAQQSVSQWRDAIAAA